MIRTFILICATLLACSVGTIKADNSRSVISSYVMKGTHYIRVSVPELTRQWKPEMKHAWVIPAVDLKTLIRLQKALDEKAGEYAPQNTVIFYDEELEPLMKDFAEGYVKQNIGNTGQGEKKPDYVLMTGSLTDGKHNNCDILFTHEKIYKKGELPK